MKRYERHVRLRQALLDLQLGSAESSIEIMRSRRLYLLKYTHTMAERMGMHVSVKTMIRGGQEFIVIREKDAGNSLPVAEARTGTDATTSVTSVPAL